MRRTLRAIRWLLDLALLGLVGTLLALALATNIGPRFGHQLVVIRGSSMSPAIPLGSVVDLDHVSASELRVGDVVTVRSPGGTAYTHRIVRLVSLPDGEYMETEGDAVGHPDAPLQPVSEVAGRVDFSSPFLGYLIYMLTMPSGIVSLFSLALTLLLLIWLLEEVEDDGFDVGDNLRDRKGPNGKAVMQRKIELWRIESRGPTVAPARPFVSWDASDSPPGGLIG